MYLGGAHTISSNCPGRVPGRRRSAARVAEAGQNSEPRRAKTREPRRAKTREPRRAKTPKLRAEACQNSGAQACQNSGAEACQNSGAEACQNSEDEACQNSEPRRANTRGPRRAKTREPRRARTYALLNDPLAVFSINIPYLITIKLGQTDRGVTCPAQRSESPWFAAAEAGAVGVAAATREWTGKGIVGRYVRMQVLLMLMLRSLLLAGSAGSLGYASGRGVASWCAAAHVGGADIGCLAPSGRMLLLLLCAWIGAGHLSMRQDITESNQRHEPACSHPSSV